MPDPKEKKDVLEPTVEDGDDSGEKHVVVLAVHSAHGGVARCSVAAYWHEWPQAATSCRPRRSPVQRGMTASA